MMRGTGEANLRASLLMKWVCLNHWYNVKALAVLSSIARRKDPDEAIKRIGKTAVLEFKNDQGQNCYDW